MKTDNSKKITLLLSLTGVIVLVFSFLQWLNDSSYSLLGIISALTSVVIALAIYLEFVPEWMNFWSINEDKHDKNDKINNNILIRIFFFYTAVCVVILLMIYFIRYIKGYSATFYDSILVWGETDANHYKDISREWYLSEGEWDRLVQLVFLPGYPLLIKLLAVIVKDYYIAGIIVSIASFSLSGCMMYKLMRLDYSHKEALKAVKYMCIIPASFFFAGPMSESLFLLLCISCIYCLRTEKWFWGCILGGYAAFTRSLGITLLVPAVMELVRKTVNTDKEACNTTELLSKVASLIIIPSGLAAYCAINYFVSGNPFKFMEYQSTHWGQNPGWFFNTAAYQTELIASNWQSNFKIILGLWLPNVLMFFISLIIVLLTVKKLRAGYTAWFIAYFIISMGATWLLSAPRYLAALVVMPVALSQIAENKKADNIITCCCLIFNLIYLYTFSVRWYVW